MIVRGATELAAKTDRIAGRLERPDGAEAKLSDILRARIARRFSAGGEGDWPEHAPATIERWGAHPTLRLSGALEAALTDGHAQASGSQIRYAPDAPFYGAIVNPRRPIIPPGDAELASELADALAAHAFQGES